MSETRVTPAYARDLLRYAYRPALRKLETELKEAQKDIEELQKKIEEKKAKIAFLEKRSSEVETW